MLIIDTRDTRKTQNLLGQLRARVQGLDPLMQEIRSITDESIQRGFDTEKDPAGIDWAPLADSTIASRNRKGLVPIKILTATGKGRSSIKVEATSNQVTASFPDDSYMRFHQTGTRRMPKRQFMPNSDELEKLPLGRAIAQATEDYLTPTADEFVAGELARTPRFIRSVFGR